MSSRKSRTSRAGFSLFELLIAAVVLGLAAAGMGKLMLNAAQAGRTAGAIGYRTAVLQAEVARITAALPGTVPDGTTSTTVTTQPFPYVLTTSAVTSATTQVVSITVTPTGPYAIPAVVRTVQRTFATVSPFGGP